MFCPHASGLTPSYLRVSLNIERPDRRRTNPPGPFLFVERSTRQVLSLRVTIAEGGGSSYLIHYLLSVLGIPLFDALSFKAPCLYGIENKRFGFVC